MVQISKIIYHQSWIRNYAHNFSTSTSLRLGKFRRWDCASDKYQSGVPDICSNIRLKYKYEKFEILFCVQNLIFSIQPSSAQSCQQDFLQSNQSPKKRVSGLTISIFFFFFMFFVWFFDIFHLSLEHNQSWKKRLSWKRTSRCRIRLTTDAATSIY